jgi:hypothetical protein
MPDETGRVCRVRAWLIIPRAVARVRLVFVKAEV